MNEKQELEQQIAKLKGEVERLELLKNTRNKEANDLIAQIRREEGDWAQRRATVQGELKALQVELEQLRGQHDESARQVDQARADRESEARRVSEMKTWERACETHCDDLHEMIRSGQANAAWVQEVSERKLLLQAEIEGLEQRIRDLVAQEREIGEQRSKDEKDWADRLHEAQAALQEAKRMEADAEEKLAKLNAAEAQIQATTVRLAEKERELGERERNVEIVRRELEDAAADVERQRHSLEELGERYSAEAVRLNEAREEGLERNTRLNDWQGELEGIAERVAKRQAVLDQKERDLVAREEAVAEQERQNDDRLQKLRENAEDLHRRQEAFKKREKESQL